MSLLQSVATPRSLRPLLAASVALSLAVGLLACSDTTFPSALPLYDADLGEVDASADEPVDSAAPMDASDAASPGATDASDGGDGSALHDGGDAGDGGHSDAGDASHDAHEDH